MGASCVGAFSSSKSEAYAATDSGSPLQQQQRQTWTVSQKLSCDGTVAVSSSAVLRCNAALRVFPDSVPDVLACLRERIRWTLSPVLKAAREIGQGHVSGDSNRNTRIAATCRGARRKSSVAECNPSLSVPSPCVTRVPNYRDPVACVGGGLQLVQWLEKTSLLNARRILEKT